MSLNLDKSTWKRVVLSDVVKNHNDYYNQQRDGALPYVAGPHIDPGVVSIQRYGSTLDDDFPPTFKRMFQSDDVLLHSRAVEKIGVVDRVGVTGEKLFILRTMDSSVVDQRFLPWLLSAPQSAKYFQDNFSGSVNKFLNWRPLAAMELVLPPLDEQQRIADLLWSIQHHSNALLSLRRNALSARQCFVDLVVEGMLAQEAKPFSSIWSRSPESGWSAAPVHEMTGLYVLSLAALGPDGYRCGQLKNVLDSADVRGAVLARGDFLISRANTADTVGRVGIYSEDRDDVSFPDTMMRLSFEPQFTAGFVEVVLSSRHGRAHMRRTAAGSATSMVKINRKSLAALPFPVVPEHEQQQLLNHVRTLRNAGSQVGLELDTLTALRQGLSAEIFGGTE